MRHFYLDTNFIVSYLYRRNEKQYTYARSYLCKAKELQIKLILLTEIIIEVNYILGKVYKFQKNEIVIMLLSLVQTSYITLPEREILFSALNDYKNHNVNLVDCILFTKAHANGGEVLSFDTDFKKLKKKSPLS